MASKKRSIGIVTLTEGIFMRFPSVSLQARKRIVRVTPYIVLLIGVLGIFGSLTAFGVLGILSPFASMGDGSGVPPLGILNVVLWFIASVLMLVAVSYLFIRRRQGWEFLFLVE